MPKKNCIFCIIQLITVFGKWFGAPCFTVKCFHSNRRNKVEVKLSRFYWSTGLMGMLFLFCGCYYYANFLFVSYKSFFEVKWMLSLTDFLSCVRSCMTSYISIKYWKIGHQCLLAMDYQIQQHRIATTKILLSKSTVRNLSTHVVWYIMGCWILLILDIVDQKSPNYLYKSFELFTFIFNLIVTVTFKTMCMIYQALIDSAYNYLKDVLNSPGRHTLTKGLPGSVRLYLSLIHNIKNYMSIYNSGLVFWLISTLVLVIINAFMYVLLIFEQVEMASLIIISARVFITYAIAMVILIEVEKFRESNKRMLSFLYKYPLSQLTAEEASQIELIINVFRLCKPSLNAMGIFEMGVKLCATCSGTVITYILVLLQFYLPWVSKSDT